MMRAMFVLALVAGCGSSKSSPPPSNGGGGPAPGEAPDNCSAPEDCELVSACCGCNAGGRQIAIRKDAVAAYESSRVPRCGGTMCAQMISTDPSCDAEATCGANGRCTVVPHMQHADPADH
jgi:hypothetical protein